jgi:hypothetical protein
VEQLSSELMQLKLQRKIDKLKKKLKDSKSCQLTSSSSSNEETDDTSEEEVKGKGNRGRKGDKRSYNTTSFNCDNLPPSNTFTSVPIGKAPHIRVSGQLCIQVLNSPMKMKNQAMSNFNKFIATLKLHQFSYPHWRKMSLIGSMVFRRPKKYGTLFKEPMKAPSP